MHCIESDRPFALLCRNMVPPPKLLRLTSDLSNMFTVVVCICEHCKAPHWVPTEIPQTFYKSAMCCFEIVKDI